jgi:uncharacterized glyoxalase superfamily protein PhnB
MSSDTHASVLAVAPVLLVRDIRASIEYWRDKVGFNVDRVFGAPVHFAMPHRDGVTIMLAQCPHGCVPPEPNWKAAKATNQAYFWVDDAATLYEEIVGRGATIDWTLYDTPWGTREFGIQDLDEHDIAFGEVLAARQGP